MADEISEKEKEDSLIEESESLADNDILSPEISKMFAHKSKMSHLVPKEWISSYKRLYIYIKECQMNGELPLHPHNNYLDEAELAISIYNNKYFLKDLDGNKIDKRPEDVFTRLAAYIAAVEPEDMQRHYAKRFYNLLYNGIFLPGGRVIAGAGDLYRVKTFANCFTTLIEKDNIESIYKAAYECARTYSYGGGIGLDLSCLRPQNSVVHNAANQSTGAVSFTELYSLTTGLIGQAGRRGALMMTLDVKHPDIFLFLDLKRHPNWITNQIVEQCRMSGKFNEDHLAEIKRQVIENIQVRFANISVKVSDEFMQAVSEQKAYNNRILLYKKFNKAFVHTYKQNEDTHYSFEIPSKNIDEYSLYSDFDNIESLNAFLNENFSVVVAEEQLKNSENRDIYGDYVVPLNNEKFDLAIKFAGDYMLYYGSEQVGDIKRLIKANKLWNRFVASNYKTAEPGLIFWSTMTRYSPSNYMGRPICCTNPCGEVPLDDGGACNLASINLSQCVANGFSQDAQVEWKKIKDSIFDIVRFLDNVIVWNEILNPLEKQRRSAKECRRLGIGYMGIADMLGQLGLGYDSKEGIAVLGKVAKFIANSCYQASAMIAKNKGSFPLFNYDDYEKGRFFAECLEDETKELIKIHGLRNIALLSIAPTGTISNVILSYKDGDKNYIGVSGGIEPVFSVYYNRRSESFGNKVFKMFHSTVQAYIDKTGLRDKVDETETIEELEKILPPHFFKTSHNIDPIKRVEIQGLCQKYIDHSISSTVNLPMSIEPETISDIYIHAWRQKLKGVTIYRDGSRFPILSIKQKQESFSTIKDKKFRVVEVVNEQIIKGDDVIETSDGKLTTPFHAMQDAKSKYMVQEISNKKGDIKKDGENEGTGQLSDSDNKGACKVKLVDGKLVKSCSE
ncbi:MAG: adenosylcobalamin-dependent ribonucleoside-diphosphate reductase [Candidatus Woesearchaeota archaeon]